MPLVKMKPVTKVNVFIGNQEYWCASVIHRMTPADEEWTIVHQIVIDEKFWVWHMNRQWLVIWVNKTYLKILNHFYWPHLKGDVSAYCNSCHVCQVVGKPNKTIPVASLKPILPCREPFSEIIIDCVGRPHQVISICSQLCVSLHVFQRLFFFETLRLLKLWNSLSNFSHLLAFLPWCSQIKDQILCLVWCNRSLTSWESSSANWQHTIQNLKGHLNIFTKFWKPWFMLTVFSKRNGGAREFIYYFLQYTKQSRNPWALVHLS